MGAPAGQGQGIGAFGGAEKGIFNKVEMILFLAQKSGRDEKLKIPRKISLPGG